ncbi:IS200/IS605 family transposase [Puteibacter caeruleilacunae]|nr:IS200/IS605 family transposase [Puteibacter caeruleilacunae]
MSNTYTQCYVHIVFAVKGRHTNGSQIRVGKKWKEDLQKYMTSVIQANHHKLLAINCMPDHTHIFIGYHLAQPIPLLVKKIKESTTKWITQNRLSYNPFSWQDGYGAFTYSRSQISNVANYIENQEEHHKKITFKDEYLKILKDFNVDYNPKYLFEFNDD